MSKSMHVTFNDGSSYTYDNVPDEVQASDVQQRALSDFPDKKITNTSEGAHPEVAPIEQVSPKQEPSTGEKLGAGAITAFNEANQFLETPVGKTAKELALYGIGGGVLGHVLKNKLIGQFTPPAGATPPVAPTPGPVPPSTATAPNRLAMPSPASQVNISPQAQAMARPPVAPPAAAGSATPGMMEQAANLYRAYGPAALEMMGKLAKGAGATALMTYSQGLNTGEDEALADMRKRYPDQTNAVNSGFTKQLNSLTKRTY
jgi:hypothetical protein